MIEELTIEFQGNEDAGISQNYLNRHDNKGIISKIIISQLRMDIEDNQIPLFYQPQMDSTHTVVGAEALLRWQYHGEPIYPPLIISLAREDGCLDLLTKNIFYTVCREINDIRQQVGTDFRISVNIVAEQLNTISFIQSIIAIANQFQVCDHLYLEVTEETSLFAFTNISDNIEQLRQSGILMAIDDFSMGHTSLNYLKNNGFSYVKLDGALVRQVMDNPRCCKIISSIVLLGNSLDFKVIAEYVETDQIQNILLELGCQFFQGYLYSPAIPCNKFIQYYQETNMK